MVYKPVKVRDRELVDGGIVSTTNLDIAVEAGAKFVVVVNPLVPYVNDFTKRVPTLLGSRPRRVSDMGFPQIGYQAFKLLAYQRLHEMAHQWEQRYPGVDIVLIEPEPNDELMFQTSIMNFTSRVDIARHGFESVTLKLAEDYDRFREVCERHGIEISATRVRKVVKHFAAEKEKTRAWRKILEQTTGRCCASRAPPRPATSRPQGAFRIRPDDPVVTRILVVDDQPVVRAGLAAVLRGEPGLVPVGATGPDNGILPAIRRAEPHVVLLNVHLPAIDELVLTRRVKRQAKGAGRALRTRARRLAVRRRVTGRRRRRRQPPGGPGGALRRDPHGRARRAHAAHRPDGDPHGDPRRARGGRPADLQHAPRRHAALRGRAPRRPHAARAVTPHRGDALRLTVAA